MKWLFEVFFVGGVIFAGIMFVGGGNSSPVSCSCPKVPENYFIIETKETEMCLTEDRTTVVTQIIKQGKVDFN